MVFACMFFVHITFVTLARIFLNRGKKKDNRVCLLHWWAMMQKPVASSPSNVFFKRASEASAFLFLTDLCAGKNWEDCRVAFFLCCPKHGYGSLLREGCCLSFFFAPQACPYLLKDGSMAEKTSSPTSSSTSSPAAAFTSSVTFSQKPARDPESSGRGDETRHLASLGRAKHPMLNVSLLTSSCSYQTAIIRNDKAKNKKYINNLWNRIGLFSSNILTWDFRHRLPPQAKFTESICKVAKTKSSFLANFCVCIFPCNSYGFHAPITKYLTKYF